MPNVQSYKLVKGIDESRDLAGPLDETLQETLVQGISHDLVCVKNLTESTYIEISTSKNP